MYKIINSNVYGRMVSSVKLRTILDKINSNNLYIFELNNKYIHNIMIT